MRLAATVFVLSFIVVVQAQTGVSAPQKDIKAIEELHKKDLAATKAYDIPALASLWTGDVISLPPNGSVTRGKAANLETLEAGREILQSYEVLDYRQEWEELIVAGDYAFEWGTFYSTMKSKLTEAVQRSDNRVMRILKRQADGSWKVHRTIWNNLPGPPPRVSAPEPKK